MNIFIGSLPFKVEENELRELFEKYGEVTSVKIITDKFTGRSKGFGFVEMTNDEEGAKAIEELNGKEVGGRSIIVNTAKEKTESRGGGGGNYRNRDNNRGGGGRSRW